jgi:hypothetical protein
VRRALGLAGVTAGVVQGPKISGEFGGGLVEAFLLGDRVAAFMGGFGGARRPTGAGHGQISLGGH